MKELIERMTKERVRQAKKGNIRTAKNFGELIQVIQDQQAEIEKLKADLEYFNTNRSQLTYQLAELHDQLSQQVDPIELIKFMMRGEYSYSNDESVLEQFKKENQS